MTRAELIAALEAATGPSRELDVRIFALSNDPAIIREPGDHRGRGIVTWALSRWIKEEGCDASPVWWEYLAGCVQAPRYTSSIDTALTLVPEGVEWSISTLYGVALVDVGLNSDYPARGRRQDGNVPLALCIAALKAGEEKDG